jgi:hypothetical protein
LSAAFKTHYAAHIELFRCAPWYRYVLWRETGAAVAERSRILDTMDQVATRNWPRGLFSQSGSLDAS